MKDTERRLLIVLVTVIVGIGLIKYVYPATIKSVFELPKQVANAQKDYRDTQKERNRLEEELKNKYLDYVSRTGGTDEIVVQSDLLDRVFDLIQKSHLRYDGINPKNISEDKKSGVQTVTVTLRAKGRFRDCVEFVRGFYELPYVARLDDLKITPTEARGQVNHDEATLSGEIQALVLPMEARFGPPDAPQPEKVKKYDKAPRAYEGLASAKPFTAFFDRPKPTPTPRPVVEATTPPAPPPVLGPPTDPDGRDTVVRMLMKYGVDEVRLVNTKTKQAHYVTLGEDLDGGELVLVHLRGAVVHKETPKKDFGYYVYPKGSRLTEAMPLDQATSEPEIQLAMYEYAKAHPPELPESADKKGAGSSSDARGHVAPGSASEDILDDQPPEGDEVGPPAPDEIDDVATNSIPSIPGLETLRPSDRARLRRGLTPSVNENREGPTSDSWMRKGESKSDGKKTRRTDRNGVGKGKRPKVDKTNRISKSRSRGAKPERPND